jgi:hypothetical protein
MRMVEVCEDLGKNGFWRNFSRHSHRDRLHQSCIAEPDRRPRRVDRWSALYRPTAHGGDPKVEGRLCPRFLCFRESVERDNTAHNCVNNCREISHCKRNREPRKSGR